MARKCVCQLCKANGTVDVFYKVTDTKGRNKYYCNQDEYENFKNEKLKRKNLLYYLSKEVFHYKDGQVPPPVFLKKIGELNKFYDYEVIQKCFEKNQETIQYWLINKEFNNEFGMISYIFKIIESNINDFYKVWSLEQNRKNKEENNQIDITIMNQFNDSKPSSLKQNNSAKNITAFLDEEDNY